MEKEVDKIDESDLLALKENKVLESRTIEYKKCLPPDITKDKIKFLAGISSFANTIGGDFIIGITESKGVPTQIEGVKVDDIDKEKLRLEQLIRDGINPSIPSVIIREIKLQNGKYVFLIRIIQSWINPHRVVFNGHDKFYSRNSAGKYPLDVDELRVAFTLAESFKKKIQDFRLERISSILSKGSPDELKKNPKVVLHLIPFSSFSRVKNVDLEVVASRPLSALEPIYGATDDWRYNLEGYLSYNRTAYGEHSYAQLYRNGIIEAVDAAMLGSNDKSLKIPSRILEDELIESIKKYLLLMESLNLSPPILVFLTLLGVEGYEMDSKFRFPYEDSKHKIEKDLLALPEVLISSFEIEVAEIMKPSFDAIWNASGYKESFFYDKNGKRIER